MNYIFKNIYLILLVSLSYNANANDYFWITECKGDINNAEIIPNWFNEEGAGIYFFEIGLNISKSHLKRLESEVSNNPSLRTKISSGIDWYKKEIQSYKNLIKDEKEFSDKFSKSKNACLTSRYKESLVGKVGDGRWFCRHCGDRLIYLIQGDNGKLTLGNYKFTAKVHLNEHILKEQTDWLSCSRFKTTKVVKNVYLEKKVTKEQKNVYFELDKEIFDRLKVHCDGAKVEIKITKDGKVIHEVVRKIPHWQHSTPNLD